MFSNSDALRLWGDVSRIRRSFLAHPDLRPYPVKNISGPGIFFDRAILKHFHRRRSLMETKRTSRALVLLILLILSSFFIGYNSAAGAATKTLKIGVVMPIDGKTRLSPGYRSKRDKYHPAQDPCPGQAVRGLAEKRGRTRTKPGHLPSSASGPAGAWPARAG